MENVRLLGIFAIVIGLYLIFLGWAGVSNIAGQTIVDFPLVHIETETDAGAIRLLLIVIGAMLTFAGFRSQGIRI